MLLALLNAYRLLTSRHSGTHFVAGSLAVLAITPGEGHSLATQVSNETSCSPVPDYMTVPANACFQHAVWQAAKTFAQLL